MFENQTDDAIKKYFFSGLSIKFDSTRQRPCNFHLAKVPRYNQGKPKVPLLRQTVVKGDDASGPPTTYLGIAKAIRKLRIAGIFQHYYPEGGWGYLIIISALLVQILAHGVQLSMGMVMVQILTRRQNPSQVTVTEAGKTDLSTTFKIF